MGQRVDFLYVLGLKIFCYLSNDIVRYVDETQDNLLIETLCTDNVLQTSFFTENSYTTSTAYALPKPRWIILGR